MAIGLFGIHNRSYYFPSLKPLLPIVIHTFCYTIAARTWYFVLSVMSLCGTFCIVLSAALHKGMSTSAIHSFYSHLCCGYYHKHLSNQSSSSHKTWIVKNNKQNNNYIKLHRLILHSWLAHAPTLLINCFDHIVPRHHILANFLSQVQDEQKTPFVALCSKTLWEYPPKIL